MCRAIGRTAPTCSRRGEGVLTHCNAGGLATADYGTALAVIFAAHEQGKPIHVYRRRDPAAVAGGPPDRLGAAAPGVPVTLICDNMAAQVMKEGKVQAVVVGADRIAANGDAANKIGTYGVALLAKAHGIPFYVAAPSSTFDLRDPRRLRTSRSSSATPARSPTASAARPPPRGSRSTTPPST